jgi:gamma-glutamylcyclotransferase (GGCT)/AIG2-like uncharacterized protein YtfP
MTNAENLPLFVYGTLLTVARHPMGNLLREHGEFAGTGSIRARLYIIDDPDEPGQNFYPGAVPSANNEDRVHGELYALHSPELVLGEFDDYEACSPRWPEPHEFLRRRVEVLLECGTVKPALTYLYTWDVTSARHIASGRFTEASPDVR